MMARGCVKKKDTKKMMLTSMSVIIMSLNWKNRGHQHFAVSDIFFIDLLLYITFKLTLRCIYQWYPVPSLSSLNSNCWFTSHFLAFNTRIKYCLSLGKARISCHGKKCLINIFSFIFRKLKAVDWKVEWALLK